MGLGAKARFHTSIFAIIDQLSLRVDLVLVLRWTVRTKVPAINHNAKIVNAIKVGNITVTGTVHGCHDTYSAKCICMPEKEQPPTLFV